MNGTRFLRLLGYGLVAAFLPALGLRGDDFVPGLRQAQVHNPASPRYVDFLPQHARHKHAGHVIKGDAHHGHHGPGQVHLGISGTFLSVSGYGLLGGYGWGALGYGGYGYGCGAYSPIAPYYGVGLYPPILHAEPFFGVPAALRGPAVVPIVPRPPVMILLDKDKGGPNAAGQAKGAAADKPQRRLAPSGAEARERAWKFIDYGDKHFAQQSYRTAYERYSRAAASAPDMVEAYLRQGQSLVAVGNYELAARAYKRVIKTLPDWTEAQFRLADLYGENAFAKGAHLEALAAAAEKDPANGDLMLILAMQLYYDGQAERSTAFFQRAAELLAGELPEQAAAKPDAIAAPKGNAGAEL